MNDLKRVTWNERPFKLVQVHVILICFGAAKGYVRYHRITIDSESEDDLSPGQLVIPYLISYSERG